MYFCVAYLSLRPLLFTIITTDFGLSQKFARNEHLRDAVGTGTFNTILSEEIKCAMW